MKQLYEILNEKYDFSFISNSDINWKVFFKTVKDFDIEIAIAYKNEFNFSCLFSFYALTEDEIERLCEHAKWYEISMNQKLSEEFIEKHSNDVNWLLISFSQKLSENFIEKHKYDVDWSIICKFQKLSESFIKKFSYRVNWQNVSAFQKLSENFISEFANMVDWYYISRYQKLSKKFQKKYIEKLYCTEIKNNWIYKSTEEKKTSCY